MREKEGHWEITNTKMIRARKEGDAPDIEMAVRDEDLLLIKKGGKIKDAVLIFREFLGWHILLTRKLTKRRREYNFRVWRKI